MSWKISLLLLLSLLAILLAARARGTVGALTEQVDITDLGVRVELGDGAEVPPDLTGMMQEWPERPTPAAEEVALGQLLFFDPILSGNNEVSCATCHHPDLGLSDGRAHSVGAAGVPLPRSAPTLWNVAFREHLTWDGRADTLEAQMLEGPLFHPDEMAEQPEALLAELRGNEEYSRLFEEVYGELTVEQVARAIAAFEQSLISRDSAFDRFAGGEFYALTGAQRRGFELFRSNETNCIKCHELPTFSTDEFKVIGVRDDAGTFDPGRGGVSGREEEVGAFAVPTLRNVALTAPYMHNGIEPDLNGAIAFYLNGGGDNLNIPRSHLDSDLRSFNVPTRDLKDLEAFLLSLTDESAIPAIPEQLPSGLAPVEVQENPARRRVREQSALPRGAPRTHHVEAGDSIQAAIDVAHPGDTILIELGRYYETLDIDVAQLTVRGDGATLVGRRFTRTGILVRNNDLRLAGLTLEGFEGYTIYVQGAHNIHLDNVTLNGTTLSGLLDEMVGDH